MIRARNADAVHRCLRALPFDERESLMLAFYDDMSHAEIAQRLGRALAEDQ